MDYEPKDVMVLGAIKSGARKFDKIIKATKIEPKELNEILERLEKRELIEVRERKGWLGKKIEIHTTKKGDNELENRIFELNQNWNQMSTLYKSGDKQKLQDYFDSNRSFFPMMMFFGIMDIMMFSTMLSFMGSQMTDYVPSEQIPDGMDDADGTDADMGDGDFDIDIGF